MKTEKLIALKAEFDAVKDDYNHPRRIAIIESYNDELTACGRRYFDDRLNAWAMDHGCLYGEDTMLAMIADGTLETNDLNASVQRHCLPLLIEAQTSDQEPTNN